MATFNRSHLIEETLKSISNQIYKNWECIIIDDGSNDYTEKVVNKWVNKDQRYNYYKRNNQHKKGLPGCRNQGLEIAKGDYIIFFDDDDIVHPQNLELSMSFFNNKKADFVHYNKKTFSEINEIKIQNYLSPQIAFKIDKEKIYESITGKLGLASCTVMWQINAFDKFKFNETLHYAEEWDLYNRLLINNFEGYKIENILYFNRKHSNSNTASYYNKNSERIQTKKNACVSLVIALDQENLLNLSYVKYFLGIRKKSESKPIHKALLKAKSLKLMEKLYVRFRYTFLPQLKYLYSLKKLNN
jgi:glycosyltransferase involved in cell wall biosynthesis